MAVAQPQEDSYMLARDNAASLRLNYQHYCIKQLCGYILHPLVPLDNPNLRIADIGTGTGLWPSELSHGLPPTARIDGFDLSAAQYPPRNWLPANVHLHVQNSFAPFPPEHIGTYDIVHLRLFFTLLNSTNVEKLIQNLFTLLKPGGYLQWLDCDGRSYRAIPASPSSPKDASVKMAAWARKPRPEADYSWLAHTPSILTRAGFHPLTHDTIPIRDECRPVWAQTGLLGLQEIAATTKDAGVAEELRGIIKGVKREMAEGTTVEVDFFCVVARKLG